MPRGFEALIDEGQEPDLSVYNVEEEPIDLLSRGYAQEALRQMFSQRDPLNLLGIDGVSVRGNSVSDELPLLNPPLFEASELTPDSVEVGFDPGVAPEANMAFDDLLPEDSEFDLFTSLFRG